MTILLFATLFNFITYISLTSSTTTTQTPIITNPPVTTATVYSHLDIGCNYVNIDGVALPTDKCESITYHGQPSSYMYKCNNNEYPNYSSIVMLYYFTSDCQDSTGTNSLVTDILNITDYVCSYDITTNNKCENNQLIVKRYSHDFQSNITCIHDNNFIEMETQIINKCILAKGSNPFQYYKYECDGADLYRDLHWDNQCNSWNETHMPMIDNECIDGKIVRFTCPDATTTTTFAPQTYDHIDIGCNYVTDSNGFAIPTDKCLINVDDGNTMSFIYKCNENNEYNIASPIVQLVYNNGNCEYDNIKPPYVIEVDDIIDYVCIYNEENNDKCINNQIDLQIYYNSQCTRNNDYTHSLTKIANKCFKINNNPNQYSKCECNGNILQGTFYSDDECMTLIGRTTVINNECDNDGNLYTHSCDIIDCNYVNYDGFASRLDVCHPSPHKGETLGFYKLECDSTIDGNILLNWWGSNNGCFGSPLQSYPLNIGYDIIDYKCDGNQCSSNDVLILQMFENNECYKSDESYRIADMIVNKCTKNRNGSQIVQCDYDFNSQDMGYKIVKYSDEYCNNILIEERYSEIECKNHQNLEFVLWCNGPNEIEYFDEKCEFHMNNEIINNERKYLIHAINKCSEFKLANGYFSNKYICNNNNNGITQIWYKGRKCNQQLKIANYSFNTNKNNFNCFHKINTNNEQCDNDNKLLTLRWYNKDPLTSKGNCIKKKGFYHDNYIITNICIPDFTKTLNNQIVYTMIDCDKYKLNGFQIAFYSHPQCKSTSKLNHIIFKNGDCFNGDIIQVIGCKGNF